MKKFCSHLYLASILFLASLPGVLLAQQGEDGTGDVQGEDGTGGGRYTGGEGVQLQNPLGDQTLLGFFQDILDVIMVFAVPIIVFFIIYAGFKYVMAQGKPEEISTANRALLFAVVGGVLILGAQLLLYVISGTINALG
ncbi:MAG: pilin [Candidatus Paceibacterota bacterium]